MIVETFADFCVAVAKYSTEAPASWRAGQVAANLLSRVRPDLTLLISGSDYDPFYEDEALILFYDFLARHW